jgi:alpha(1,3/1,4) fucosyltransferase
VNIAFYCDTDARVSKNIFIDLNDGDYSNFAKFLRTEGHTVNTFDVFVRKKLQIDVMIFFDMPYDYWSAKRFIEDSQIITILWLREPENVRPDNYYLHLHRKFDFIQTWKTYYWDNKKYFPYSCTRVDITKRQNKITSFDLKKHMCMINANKHSDIEGELYSYRLDFIKWCDSNIPSLFDLYGFRWERKIFRGNKAKRALNRLPIPNFLTGYKIPKTYKGQVTDKIHTLSQYKYVFVTENTMAEDDYVSEKIFDAFLSSSVPIYLGCPNISNLVDKRAFIDASQFRNFSDLYDYTIDINANEYNSFLEYGEKALSSKYASELSPESWKNRNYNVVQLAMKKYNEKTT